MNLYSNSGGLNLSGSNGTVRWNPVSGAAQDVPVQK
jgi:hypothetical protein